MPVTTSAVVGIADNDDGSAIGEAPFDPDVPAKVLVPDPSTPARVCLCAIANRKLPFSSYDRETCQI